MGNRLYFGLHDFFYGEVVMQVEELLKISKKFQNIYPMFPDWLRPKLYVRQFKTGDIVHNKDEYIDYFGILCTGAIKIVNAFENGNIYLIQKNIPIDFIGEVVLISGYQKSSVRIVAVEDSYAVFMSANDCKRLFEENFEFYKLVTKKIAQKLYMHSYKHGVTLSYPPKFILAEYLITKFEKQKNPELRILETRETIAEETGVNLRTLNRAIKNLREEDFLTINHGKIRVTKKHISHLKEWMAQYKF